jgi:ElaB/YqjD/DUF883 family membrane-anchored ribosome-binding protein
MENGNQPATKADLQQLRSDTKQDLQQLRFDTKHDLEQLRSDTKQDLEQLRSEFHHGFDDLKEVFRDSQTELLKAFYSFTESNHQRVTQIEGNQATLIARVGTLEQRITELEKKINFPEHPTQ